MPVKVVKGDIFNTSIKCIGHGCNNQGVMGSGIAAVIRDKFPEAYQEYKVWCSATAEEDLLGDTLVVESNGKFIFNMVTQNFYGKDGLRYAKYDAIAECFWAANNHVLALEHGLAIPLIGAGLGGGNWNVIYEIIKSEAKDINVLIYRL